ncbi:MAG: acyltransferase family protein [Phycisphaerae bacterium]|nr:acyltransferase family protein [Saprospiraceae bacterium]
MSEQPTTDLPAVALAKEGANPPNNSHVKVSPLSPWPDRLRNLATVMVIGIHVAAPIAHGEGLDFNGSWWWAGNFWNSLTRPAVPLFVMLSGYLLLGKDYPLPDFLKRRFSRVMIPAIFWMLIYCFYNYMTKGSPATIGEALRSLVTGPVHYHLWFIYLIIGLYLVYPILRPWVRTATNQDFLYFIVMWCIGTWVAKALYTYAQMPIGIYFELFTNNCGYFVMGYFLGNRVMTNTVNSEKVEEPVVGQSSSFTIGRHTPWLMIAIGTAGTMLASYCMNTIFWNGHTIVYFYDYLTPNVAISAIGWFLLAKTAFNRIPLLDIERDFSAASFGIYFAHVLVMDFCGKLGYWHSMAHPIYVSPMLAAMIASLTFLAIALIRVLPFGQRVT